MVESRVAVAVERWAARGFVFLPVDDRDPLIPTGRTLLRRGRVVLFRAREAPARVAAAIERACRSWKKIDK